MYSLCVITPTVGRAGLLDTLTSAPLSPGDEWIVIGDGEQPGAKALVKSLNLPYLRYINGPRTGYYGNAQRDIAMLLSDRDYFVFLDDDDVFTGPAAPEILRGKLSGGPCIFKMIQPTGETIWRTPALEPGNVGGAMFCPPNIPARLGRWDNRGEHASDFGFIHGTLRHWGEPLWIDDVLIRCQPGEAKQ